MHKQSEKSSTIHYNYTALAYLYFIILDYKSSEAYKTFVRCIVAKLEYKINFKDRFCALT